MRYLALAFGFVATGAVAQVPRVAVDIAPVHSIVAAVMGDLGAPALIVPPGASPHGYAMRPSQAAALDRADLVVWMGQTLTPWMAGSVESLAGDAVSVVLLDEPKTRLLAVREGATFADKDHADEDAQGEGGAMPDDHGAGDPHAWLDPDNAMIWAELIAGKLAGIDPENAAVYSDNAKAFVNEINVLKGEIDAMLNPVRGRPFVVFHDAYHYFENRFDIEAAGAVAASDAASPSAARVSEVRSVIARLGAVCALTEPQFNPAILASIGAAQLGEVDPIGVSLTPGRDQYGTMLTNMATAIANCLE